MKLIFSPLLLLLLLLWAPRLGEQLDLSGPFRDFNQKGSITIYDYKNQKWIFSDSADSYRPTLPASTFKIINTLIALQTGAVKNVDDTIKWNGATDTAKYGYRPEIYHDMSVREAFKVSAVWVYLELARKVGKDEYRKILSDCHYGNADLSVDGDDFWNFGNLVISPVNQVEILKGIYEETLPFKKEYFRIVKGIMADEQAATYTLRAKTGWARDSLNEVGWWVGYVERKDNVYFFATRLTKARKTPNPNFGPCRKDITRAVLKQLNIIE
jgi:beta-lactamase class D